MSDLVARIREAMKNAMRAQQKERLGVIRLALSAFKQYEVDTRNELDDTQALAILDKMVKQRRESIRQYREANREDLAAVEEKEIVILQEFLPQPLSDAEIDQLIDEAVAATGAASMQDMGKVMGQLKPKLQGRADMGAVSAKIRARLS